MDWMVGMDGDWSGADWMHGGQVENLRYVDEFMRLTWVEARGPLRLGQRAATVGPGGYGETHANRFR